uniref:FecR family protein n=1 Tax=uncultured Sphingomonas sp. TaxID=158754 RepID=UPI0035CB8893
MSARPNQYDATLRQESVRWFGVHRSGDMTEQEMAALAAWRATVPGASDHFDRLQRQWAALGAVADDPAILVIREHDLRAYNCPERIKMLMAVAAAMLLLVTSAATFLHYDPFAPFEPSGGETFRTGNGQRTIATLIDGSVVTLDAESELRVVEMGARRRLQLVRGRAFFEVAKDKAHPFLVEAMRKTIRAVGTKFDVRVDADDKVTVTLVEGKVAVDQPVGWRQPAAHVELVAGGRLVAPPGRRWRVAHVDTANDTSWLSGRLTFVREPLADAIAEVNRYSTRRIVFVDGPSPATSIVGVFVAGDTDGFVTALELNGIARTVSRSDTEIKLARWPNAGSPLQGDDPADARRGDDGHSAGQAYSAQPDRNRRTRD